MVSLDDNLHTWIVTSHNFLKKTKHDSYKCLLEQACFGVLVCSHVEAAGHVMCSQLQVFPLPFSTHSSTSWENHQGTSAVGFSIIKFASLFLKMHRRHELESCGCYYWCLQGSRDLINTGSGSFLLVAFWGLRFLLVEAFVHALSVNKGCGSQGATLPFSTHSSTSSENQISVLVCKTATNACCGKLAWVFWSALTLELSEFASLFLKVRPRHQWVSVVYWCLQGSKHPNTIKYW